jgi:carboxyl-terminal processing protease
MLRPEGVNQSAVVSLAAPPDEDEGDTTTGPPPKYRTDEGRVVLGGGGITPDVLLPAATRTASDSAFDQALGKQIPQFRDALTEYALSMKGSRLVASPDFVVTPEMRAGLLARMRAHGLTMSDSTFAASTGIVDRLLGYEIARYVFGSEAEYARRIRDDRAIGRAVEFARGAATQQALLDRAAHQ